jgi:hypothetical protein
MQSERSWSGGAWLARGGEVSRNEVELAVGGGEERARSGAASVGEARAGRPVGQAGAGEAVMRVAMACCVGERSQRGGAGRDEADGAVDAALTAG